jgi:hypothetical protein
MINLVNKAEDFMKAKGAFFEKKEAPAGHLQCAFCSVSLANLRKNVCVAAGMFFFYISFFFPSVSLADLRKNVCVAA